LTDVWPTELRIKDQGHTFEMLCESGEGFVIPAELLRVESPSAEVKGHGPGQETLVWGKKTVTITRAEPVGNYAVRLHFNDGHNTGLFTWTYLAELGRDVDGKMKAYEARLKAAGLSR
jgi:DUF971 family protein